MRSCLWLVVLLPLSAAADAALVDRIAATVDTFAITVRAVDARAKPALTGTAADQQRARARALDELIEEQLVARDAAKLGVTVTEAEIDQALAEVAKQNQLEVEQLFAEVKKQGLTPSAYRAMVGTQLRSLRWLNLRVDRTAPPDAEAERAGWMAAQRARLIAELKAAAVIEVRR